MIDKITLSNKNSTSIPSSFYQLNFTVNKNGKRTYSKDGISFMLHQNNSISIIVNPTKLMNGNNLIRGKLSDLLGTREFILNEYDLDIKEFFVTSIELGLNIQLKYPIIRYQKLINSFYKRGNYMPYYYNGTKYFLNQSKTCTIIIYDKIKEIKSHRDLNIEIPFHHVLRIESKNKKLNIKFSDILIEKKYLKLVNSLTEQLKCLNMRRIPNILNAASKNDFIKSIISNGINQLGGIGCTFQLLEELTKQNKINSSQATRTRTYLKSIYNDQPQYEHELIHELRTKIERSLALVL